MNSPSIRSILVGIALLVPVAVPVRAAGRGERALLERCAPEVSPVTMAALVAQESGGDPYALDDDSTHIVYHPVSYAGAVRLAAELIGAGHSVDLGLAQVNSGWLAPLHLTAAELLEPCENLRAGSLILLRAWRAAGVGTPAGGNSVPGVPARAKRLARALAIYHSGNPRSLAGRQYAAETYRHAGVHVIVPAIPGGHLARWESGSPAARGALRPPAPVRVIASGAASPQTSPLLPRGDGLTPASLTPIH
jgi:type IV secretion system protein VirB1